MNTNTELSRRWFEEGWGQRRPAVFRELAPTVLTSTKLASGQIFHLDEFLAFYDELIAAMPDARIDIERIAPTDGGSVVAWRLRGTHGGAGFGCQPTGAEIDVVGSTWHVIKDGRIISGEDHWDFGGFLATLNG